MLSAGISEMTDREGGRVTREGFAVLAPLFVIFVLPALRLSRNNLEILGLHLSQFSELATLAAPILLVAIGAARLRHAFRSADLVYTFYLLLAPLWLAYGFASRWVGREEAFVGMLGLAVIGASGVIRNPRARDGLTFGSAVFGMGMLGLVLIEANTLRSTLAHVESRERRLIESEAARLRERAGDASLPDVYHVVFDEFQTDLFEVVATSNQRNALGGFFLFPDTTTPYGRTDMALGATFSGEPYDYSGEPYDWIWRAFNGERSLLTKLKESGYQTTGLLHQVYPVESASPFDLTLLQERYAANARRADNGDLFLSLWMVASLPDTIVDRVVPPTRLDPLKSQTLLPASYGYLSVRSLRRYLNDESTWLAHAHRYVFIHIIVPHLPVALDEGCEESESDAATIEGQTACAIRLLIELVDALKREGRYESSLIVAHGDHGSQYSTEGGSLVLLRSESKLEWQRARSRPLLLVKPAGAGASVPLRDDPRPADLYDILPTILEAAGIAPDLEAIGHSLTQPAPPPRPRDYHFYEKDPDPLRLVDGTITHYWITPDGPVFDREISIER